MFELKLQINDIVLIEAEGSELLVIDNYLSPKALYKRWNNLAKLKHYGAITHFAGLVRKEDGMQEDDGLYFEIYEPLLVQWFKKWKEKLETAESLICMAHSKGFVPVHKCSFAVSMLSSHRKIALENIELFIEDFKENAPIWKYDQRGKQRIFAKDRAKPINGSGLFGDL